MPTTFTKLKNWLAHKRQLQKDEEVIFFPQSGSLSQDGGHWALDIHGWIFEREEQEWIRKLAMRLLREASEIEWETAEASPHFRERLTMFLVDNERWKRLHFRIGEHQFRLPNSGAGGHFADQLHIPRDLAPEGGTIQGQLITLPGDTRSYQGDLHLVPQEGLSIISDIDDTIKITEVLDRPRVIENTLFLPFRPVHGMADLYRHWQSQGAAFHYVSNSPWQLYPSLSGMFAEHDFPGGSWHLNRLRIKDRSLSHFLKSAERTKPPTIAGIMEKWPKRQFILVGDSGQLDPEAYGEIARQFPGRVQHIYIRGVRDDDDPGSARFRQAFHDLPPDTWTLFRDAGEITP